MLVLLLTLVQNPLILHQYSSFLFSVENIVFVHKLQFLQKLKRLIAALYLATISVFVSTSPCIALRTCRKSCKLYIELGNSSKEVGQTTSRPLFLLGTSKASELTTRASPKIAVPSGQNNSLTMSVWSVFYASYYVITENFRYLEHS